MSVISSQPADLYYDPYSFEIDRDPYPVWRRMRDEAPLYYNDKFDFYALSRFEDVKPALLDWQTYSSGRGTVMEMVKQGVVIAPGSILFEDPPTHDVHRGLLSRVFTPKKMAAIEPQVREFCARTLDPHVGSDGFDFIADLGAVMPTRTIGMLLGIPESAQDELRARFDEGFNLKEDGVMPERDQAEYGQAQHELYYEFYEARLAEPQDDLMSALIHTEFEDHTGVRRTLTKEEVITYIGLLNGAGNETTTRLIGWTGKLLAENPDQRRDLVEDRELIPQAIEELLRIEAPSPVQARYVTKDVEHHGQPVPEGSIILLLNASANRDEREFADPDRFDIYRKIGQHLTFGYGIHFCLGAQLARLEGRVALDEVLKRFPEWDVDWDNAQQAHTSTVRGWDRLPVFVK